MVHAPREDMRMMRRRMPVLDFTDISIDITGHSFDKYLTHTAGMLFSNEDAKRDFQPNFDESGNMIKEVPDHDFMIQEDNIFSFMGGFK